MKKFLSLPSYLFLLTSAILVSCHHSSTDPQVSRGTLTMHELSSSYISSRTIRVWTPDGYPKDAPYDVLYMHDGQMLYDSAVAWNHQEWGVDEVMQNLLDSGRIRPCIVVGIDNSEDRIEEYAPDDVAQYMSSGEQAYAVGEPMGNRYLSFMVKELKPFIDSTYDVATTAEHTFVMGSSCGGLISSYALCQYPNAFGGAACLSTHVTFAHPLSFKNRPEAMDAYLTYLHERMPEANSRLIYFDCGNETADEAYLDMFGRIDSTILALGYDSVHYRHLFFPGAAHTETDWQRRLHIPLQFLLGN
ncbi:MAG: esterase family protein [Bacteroidales bacterium]|nr:esterase family protein [Candidatus Colicola caccequi]